MPEDDSIETYYLLSPLEDDGPSPSSAPLIAYQQKTMSDDDSIETYNLLSPPKDDDGPSPSSVSSRGNSKATLKEDDETKIQKQKETFAEWDKELA